MGLWRRLNEWAGCTEPENLRTAIMDMHRENYLAHSSWAGFCPISQKYLCEVLLEASAALRTPKNGVPKLPEASCT